MRFSYRPAITLAAETGDPVLTLRPEIPITLSGPRGSGSYLALVDTGADHITVPKRIAIDLGVDLVPGRGPELVGFGGEKLPVEFGDLDIEIQNEQNPSETYRWCIRAQFFEFASAKEENLVLGHAEFLDYFTATFDGESGELTLVANREMPATKK